MAGANRSYLAFWKADLPSSLVPTVNDEEILLFRFSRIECAMLEAC